jgi:hypothetical protein
MICTWPVPPSNFFFFPYWMQERRNGTHELFPDNYFIDLLLHICGASAQARCKHPSISRPDTFPPPESMGSVQSSFEIFAIESYSVEGRPECHKRPSRVSQSGRAMRDWAQEQTTNKLSNRSAASSSSSSSSNYRNRGNGVGG